MNSRKRIAPLLSVAFFVFASSVHAHRLGESYLFLEVYEHELRGRLEINIADLDRAVGLDGDQDGNVSDAELDAKKEIAKSYVVEHLSLAPDGQARSYEIESVAMQLSRLGKYALVNIVMSGLAGSPTTIDLDYSILFEKDPTHKGFLVLNYNAESEEVLEAELASMVFTPTTTRQTLDLSEIDRLAEFGRFLIQGVWHIWIGIDHILFLIALLLPAVLVPSGTRWEPSPEFRPALFNVLKIVTLFTIAHSVTLCLAVFLGDDMPIPPWLVESVIALSIAFAALNNIFLWIPHGTGWVVYGFGFFHGFGFASVLSHLGLSSGSLAVPLFGFNLGVEVGQVAIICVAFPILYGLRRLPLYQPGVLKGGSVLLTIVALYWFVERAFLGG